MGNKRVTSLYIRLNDNRLIDIEQDKFRQRLDRLHSNWSKLIQKNKKELDVGKHTSSETLKYMNLLLL